MFSRFTSLTLLGLFFFLSLSHISLQITIVSYGCFMYFFRLYFLHRICQKTVNFTFVLTRVLTLMFGLSTSNVKKENRRENSPFAFAYRCNDDEGSCNEIIRKKN